MKHRSLVLTTFASTVLLACGGGASEPAAAASSGAEAASAPISRAAHETGSGSVTAHLGAGGGSLELQEGPRVVIEPGSITSAEQDYVLQTASMTTAFLNEESERPIGPTFAFSPSLASSAPIEVSIPLASMPEGWGEPALAYEYGVKARVGAEDSQHTRWQYENARYEGGRITATVSELTGMRLQFVLTNLEAQ